MSLSNNSNNIILLDAQYENIQTELNDCLTENTVIIVFNSEIDSCETIKTKITNYKQDNNVDINGIALFKENILNYDDKFKLFSDEESVVINVNQDDPELNTWTKFKEFVLYLEQDLQVNNFDLLMCKIYSDEDWKYIIDTIENSLSTINIRSSDDNTGHVIFDGDWVLESESVDVDMINLYFNENILELDIVLGGSFGDAICVMDSSKNIWFAGDNQNNMYALPINNSHSKFTKMTSFPSFNTDEKINLFTVMSNNVFGFLCIVTTENRIFARGRDNRKMMAGFPQEYSQGWTEISNSFLENDENIIKIMLGHNDNRNWAFVLILTDSGNVYFCGKYNDSDHRFRIVGGNSGTHQTSGFAKLIIPGTSPVVDLINELYMIKTEEKKFYSPTHNTNGFEEISLPSGETGKILISSGAYDRFFCITETNKLYVKGYSQSPSAFVHFQHGKETLATNLSNWTYITLENRQKIDLDHTVEYPIYIGSVWGATYIITNLYNTYNVGHHDLTPISLTNQAKGNQRGNNIGVNSNNNKRYWTKISVTQDNTNITNNVAKVFPHVRCSYILTKDGYLLATGKNQNSAKLGIGSSAQRKKYDWCRTSTTGDVRLTNIIQFPDEFSYSDAITLTSESSSNESSDSSGNITYDVSLNIPNDKIELSIVNSNNNFTIDLSSTNYDICYNYGLEISSNTFSNIKYWNNTFYYMPYEDADGGVDACGNTVEKMRFCVDFTNLPYFIYSNMNVDSSQIYSQFPNNPQVKFQLLLSYIDHYYGNLNAYYLLHDRDKFIQEVEVCDNSLNTNLVSFMRNSYGAMDLSYNTPTSTVQNNISRKLLDALISIANVNSTRKTTMETSIKNYINRVGNHKDVWIPLEFDVDDRIKLTFQYYFTPSLQKTYTMMIKFTADPSNNSYIYQDLLAETQMNFSTTSYEYELYNQSTTPELYRYYVSKDNTYVFTDISQNYPIAFLNHGKEHAITYEGDSSKKVQKTIMGDSVPYDFYYGDISLNILSEFDTLSFMTNIERTFVGGYKKLWYSVSS